MRKEGRKGKTGKEIRRLIVSAGSKNAGGVAVFSSVFSQESPATISSSPALVSLLPSVRPPSYARAHSPAPLVLSPGIYNTLCFPSAICLGFSAPSLTLLSRVLFLFNSAVSFRIPSSRHPRYLSEGLNERTPRRIWTILCV